MEENKVVETEETKVETPAETPAEEKKTDAKKPEKAKKAEKPSMAQRAKSAVKRNKKPIIAGAVGFVTGAVSAVAGSMWLGAKHRKAEAMAMREAPVIPEYSEPSPLDPNVME